MQRRIRNAPRCTSSSWWQTWFVPPLLFHSHTHTRTHARTHTHTHTHAHARFFLFLSLPPFVATAARPFVLPAAQPGLSWAGVHHCAVPHTHWRRPLTRAADVCGEEAAWQVGPALAQDPPRKRLWQRQVRLFLSLCLCVCVCVCVSVRLVCLSRWVCVTVSHISLLPSSFPLPPSPLPLPSLSPPSSLPLASSLLFLVSIHRTLHPGARWTIASSLRRRTCTTSTRQCVTPSSFST